MKSIQIYGLAGLVLTFGIMSCASSGVPTQTQAPRDGISDKSKQTASDLDRVGGTCILMNQPVGNEKPLLPCDKMALQLIYQKNKQMVISIIRTQMDGKFEIDVPKDGPWKLASGSTQWQADVDLLKNADGSKKVVIILKPEKTSKGKAYLMKPEKTQKGKKASS